MPRIADKPHATTPLAGTEKVLATQGSGDVHILVSDLTTAAVTAADAAINGVIGAHEIPVLAGAMGPRSTTGCAALATTAAGASQIDMVYLAFDASTQEYAQFGLPMPKSWNEGTITARFLWAHPATTTNFAVVWGIQAVAVSDDDTMAVAFGTAVEVTDTGGTTSDLYRSAATGALTVAGTPANNDMVFFQVYRKAADGADTLAVDAFLIGVVLTLTLDAETDA